MICPKFTGGASAFTLALALVSLAAPPLVAQDPELEPAAEPAAESEPKPSAHWPSYRGEYARGVADGHATPTEWSLESAKNVQWMLEVPGLSHASPVIWGDLLFLTTAVREGEGDAELKVGLYGSIASVEDDTPHRFEVVCIDRAEGEVLWTQTAWQGVPAIKRHPKGSHAASTPATDGKHVVAFFGTEGLYCYDIDGELKWKKGFGRLDSGFFMVKTAQWGFASSPVIHEGRVYVQCDVQDQSFVAALDVATGDEIWRTDRKETPGWGTPTVDIAGGRRQLLVNGWHHAGGYDLDTGAERWKLGGGGDLPVPTPVVAHDLVYLTSAHGRFSPILAVDAAATGELTIQPDDHEEIRWGVTRGGNYMQTPLEYRGLLYCCRDNGALSCFDAKTGERHYRTRIGGGGMGFTSSGVAADGKLYFTSEEGDVFVLKAGTTYEELARNELGETFMSTPAIADGALYFRARRHLFAIALDE